MSNNILAKDLVEIIPANINGLETVKLDVRSYAGYANAQYNNKEIQLFYWFFESQKFHPYQSRDNGEIGKTPLIIWLNGGPGAPSTLGLFLENGPYRIHDGSSGKLLQNQYSWNKDAHIIYWDQPIGTGYSRVKGEDPQKTFAKNECELSEMFYLSFQDFLSKHPEYRSCPVYVTGESYGGKYVPNIAMKIHGMNNDKIDKNHKINLKGICVVDGWIDARLQMKIYIDYVYTLGYLDTNQRNQMLIDYGKFCDALNEKRYEDAYNISNNIVDNVSSFGGNFNVYDIRKYSDISMNNVRTYMELATVKEALHVPKNQKWNCNDNKGPVANNLIEDNMENASAVYSEFIKHEHLYKVLMCTGTFDTACGSLCTESIFYNLDKWKNPIENEIWKTIPRKIWAQPSNVIKGFVKQYKNLTQIEFPNSGHEVPYYKPDISLDMIDKWINDKTFPSYLPELKEI